MKVDLLINALKMTQLCHRVGLEYAVYGLRANRYDIKFNHEFF